MNQLPVRDIVLYKHGVGFFVREGTVTGEQVTLNFLQDEINDVLKSLSVFDRGGGQVLGIHYQTPVNSVQQLARSSIQLDPNSTLADLLRQLRGRRVILNVQTNAQEFVDFTGRLLGLDEWENEHGRQPRVVSLLEDSGQIRAFRFSDLRGIQVEDAMAQRDLSYFLDSSLDEDHRRSIHVSLSPGEHQLVMFYVAPSPTWRVSYRLVAEYDAEAKTGKALLQGWGLFDNRLEEDLKNIRVTLVAGRPISFIYDLFSSYIPKRPKVQDIVHDAPAPIAFSAGRSQSYERAEMDEARGGSAPRQFLAKMSIDDASSSLNIQQETKDSGELFQYIVTTPVSVKRGESALVPIISSELQYTRELLYNGAKLPDYPVAALRLTNATGLTLERGPVTLVEDGDYKGEAIIPFTKPDNPLYLAFAVELGIKVTERHTSSQQTSGLHIQKSLLMYEEYLVEQINYALENTTDKPQTVTIEVTRRNGWELFGTRVADVETSEEVRWHIDIAPHSTGLFTRKERYRTYREERLEDLSYQKLQQFLENQWLDQSIIGNVSVLLDNHNSIIQAQKQREELNAERKQIYEQQEQLRANLGALSNGTQEASLRQRLLNQLEISQNRLEEIDKQVAEIKQRISEAEKRIQQIITKLNDKAEKSS